MHQGDLRFGDMMHYRSLLTAIFAGNKIGRPMLAADEANAPDCDCISTMPKLSG
jgi:hypothetical protein